MRSVNTHYTGRLRPSSKSHHRESYGFRYSHSRNSVRTRRWQDSSYQSSSLPSGLSRRLARQGWRERRNGQITKASSSEANLPNLDQMHLRVHLCVDHLHNSFRGIVVGHVHRRNRSCYPAVPWSQSGVKKRNVRQRIRVSVEMDDCKRKMLILFIRISMSIIVSFVAKALGTIQGGLFCYSSISSAGVVLILPGFTIRM